jgi:hypothetical protein
MAQGSPAHWDSGTPSSRSLENAAEKLHRQFMPANHRRNNRAYSLKNSSSDLAYFSAYFLNDLSLTRAMSVGSIIKDRVFLSSYWAGPFLDNEPKDSGPRLLLTTFARPKAR